MDVLIKDVIPVFFFTLIAVLIFVYVMTKQKNRTKLIEQGIDVAKIDSRNYVHQTNMRNGILLISLGVGFIIGHLLNRIALFDTFVAYATGLLMCEGVGFLIYYFINRNLNS